MTYLRTPNKGEMWLLVRWANCHIHKSFTNTVTPGILAEPPPPPPNTPNKKTQKNKRSKNKKQNKKKNRRNRKRQMKKNVQKKKKRRWQEKKTKERRRWWRRRKQEAEETVSGISFEGKGRGEGRQLMIHTTVTMSGMICGPPDQNLWTATLWFVCWLLACLTSQQHASISQGRIYSDKCTCCHTEIEDTDENFSLIQSQYSDTGPTSPSADPIMLGAWHGGHFLSHWYDLIQKNPGASGNRTLGLLLSRQMPWPLGQRGGVNLGEAAERQGMFMCGPFQAQRCHLQQ